MSEQEIIAKTGFYVSLISYVVFLFAEYVRPGFVMNVFSVHLFLLAVIIFGVWWSVCGTNEVKSLFSKVLHGCIRLAVSVIFGILVWSETANFGDLRIFIACIVASLPWVLYYILSREK